MANAYDVEGGSRFRAILQFLRHIYSSLQRPYASIDKLTAEVPAIEGYKTHAFLEAFETFKLPLISAPCLILPEITSDATFTVAKDASSMGITTVLLQDQGGGFQPVSY
jgi:hypothetical protein